MNPMDVFEGKVNWSAGLQPFLWSPSVVVSKLHPITGLRLYATFLDLEDQGYAKAGGGGTFQVYSGVRTKAHQQQLYNDICLRQKKCAYVANPNNVHGPDIEGTYRAGSAHMGQKQHNLWKVPELGHAIDISNGRKKKGMSAAQLNEAWRPFHVTAKKYGLQWPLNGRDVNVVERWHFVALPRRSREGWGWYPGPFPKRPGVHRPLIIGFRGGDVQQFQFQAAMVLGRPYTKPGEDRVSNDVLGDGIYGPASAGLATAAGAKVGVPAADGVWREAHQAAFERTAGKTPEPTPKPKPTPTPPAPGPGEESHLDRAEKHIRRAMNAVKKAQAEA